MGQLVYKSDCVGQKYSFAAGQLIFSCRRVKGRKKLVLGKNAASVSR